MKRIALIAEYDPAFPSHAATEAAVKHASDRIGTSLSAEWVSTEDLSDRRVRAFDGLWIGPGSPYKNMGRTLSAIQIARENTIPLLGTCGGFQHVILEYARNVLGHCDAAHAEYDPYASNLFISELACSLAGRTMHIDLKPSTSIADIYGASRISEQYYCNFGVNPAYVSLLFDSSLDVVGSDQEGEIRVVTLSDHPFYVATLYVPQMRSAPGAPHPLVSAFVQTVLDHDRTTAESGVSPI